jgi:hypothetical protein
VVHLARGDHGLHDVGVPAPVATTTAPAVNVSSPTPPSAPRSGTRFDEVQRQGGGLRECLEALLPLDPEPVIGPAVTETGTMIG